MNTIFVMRNEELSSRSPKEKRELQFALMTRSWFREQVERAGGGSYQSVINEALRQHIRRAEEPLEKTLRRVIREEIRRAS